MENNTKHTQGEIKKPIHYKMMKGNFQTSCYIHDSSGDNIARMLRDDAPSSKIQEANAEFMCKAWNNYDALINVLEKTYKEIEDTIGSNLTPKLCFEIKQLLNQLNESK